jgi:hypothetical protein
MVQGVCRWPLTAEAWELWWSEWHMDGVFFWYFGFRLTAFHRYKYFHIVSVSVFQGLGYVICVRESKKSEKGCLSDDTSLIAL